MGNYTTHTTFPLSFQPVDLGHPPRLQSKSTLVAAWHDHPEQLQKRMNNRSTRRSNQVLKLIDYHIPRHVASTFKSLTKCATHRDLNQFQLFRRGITSTQPRPYLWQKIQLKTVTTLSMVKRLKPVYEYIPQFVQIDF